jgi:hypothetical protein
MANNNNNNAARPPKINPLTTTETFTTFTNWQQMLIYTLGLDNRFNAYVNEGAVWEDGDADNHGFVDDAVHLLQDDQGNRFPDPNQHPQSAVDKVRTLHLMLGQVANYCNVIARHQIMYESTSLDSIWDMIREHYGFHVTGQRFLDLTSIRLLPGEKPADLYQRLVCFFTDNLFTCASRLTHKGRDPVVDEKLSPTIQNTIVLLWLERIHVGLPGLVKQRYGTELRNKTLASLKSEIAQALDSMLEELNSANSDTRVLRLPQASGFSNRGQQNRNFRAPQRRDPQRRDPQRRDPNATGASNPRLCSLCKTANISGWDTHFLSQCKYISAQDRRMMQSSSTRVRQTEIEEYDDVENEDAIDEVCDTFDNGLFIDNPPEATHRRVTTRKSPHLQCFYDHYPVRMCLDTGSESNLVSERFALHAGMPISTQSVHQGAVQADANSRLDVIGEVKNIRVRRGSRVFTLDALVTKQDVGDVIAGEPFLEQNDIALRSAKKQIIIGGSDVISYANASL